MKRKSSLKGLNASQHQFEQSEETYEVEYIFDKRIKKGVTQYLTKWIGYGTLSSTWEPPSHFKGVEHFIHEFEQSEASKTCVGEVPSDYEDDAILLIDAFTPSVVSVESMTEKAETKVLKKRASNTSTHSDAALEKKGKKDEEKVQDKEKTKKPKVLKKIKKRINKKKQQEEAEVLIKSDANPNSKSTTKLKSKSKLKLKREPKKENKTESVIEEKKAEVEVVKPDVPPLTKIPKARKTFSENNNIQKTEKTVEKPRKYRVREEKKKAKSKILGVAQSLVGRFSKKTNFLDQVLELAHIKSSKNHKRLTRSTASK